MKILAPCTECHRLSIERGIPPSFSWTLLNPTDSGLLQKTCDNGHVTYLVLQQMRFEVLFEIGAHAIHDNYFREAISSFASALERFLEFYIRVICRKNGIDPAVLDNAWKPVSKQSERQLGAYFFLYLTNEGSTAPYLLQNMIELRNAVVHKGKIASQEDAISFGNAVLSVINPVLQMLRDTYPEIVQAIVSDHLAEAMKHTNGKQVSTTCIRTIVSVLQDAENVTDLGNWAPPQYFS